MRSCAKTKYLLHALMLTLCFGLLFSATASAKSKAPEPPAPRAITPSDIAHMEYVSEVAISPDGETMAFVRRVGRVLMEEKNGSMWSRLAVLRRDGEIRTYVGGDVSIRSVGFTPNGKEISFLMKGAGDKGTALYTIPVDGGEAMKVASHPAGIRAYSFHPNGKQVALMAKPKPDADKKKLTSKGFNARVVDESAQNTGLWIVDVAAREAKMGTPTQISLKGSVASIAWSPEGTEIAIAMAPTSKIDDVYMFKKVHVVNVDRERITSTLKGEGKLGKVAWSPDSIRLAMLKGENINDPSNGRLMVSPAKGGSLEDVLPDLTDGSVRDFHWLSSTEIVAIVDKGVESAVYRVNVDQKTYKEVIPFGKGVFSVIRASKIGARLALRSNSPTHPPELYSWDLDGGLARKTHHNPWLDEIAFGKQEVVSYKARDGVELEGILIHPVSRRKNQKVPLILTVHGGPESHYRNGWLTFYSMAGQMAAGKGYAVFYPNYRGSTGKGVAFSRMSQGDPAGREFDDLVDGVDHLIAQGLVHKKKVGITGGSYGGFASAWGSTYYSNRFAASVMFVGVSDLISKVGTTDIQQEMYHVHLGFWPWEKWDEMLLRSPIYYANQSRTPTLIMHGESDTRVDPGQAKELYQHLKLRGKAPVRLVMYPGEGHGNSKAAARFDYNLRMLQWFDHFLMKGKKEAPNHELDYKGAIETHKGTSP